MSETIIPMARSPRLEHNRQLLEAYARLGGPHSRYPKVSDQIETIPLRGMDLAGCYNPTIIDHQGRLLIAFRYHGQTAATKLGAAFAKDNGELISRWDIDIPQEGSFEDPRFFFSNGALMLSWVHSKFPGEMRAVVKYGTYATDQITGEVQPNIGQNDWTATEKNWVFWEDDEKLYCLYRCHPTQQVYEVGATGSAWNIPGPSWPYGEIRGGTLPIKYEGKWLRFFHSTLWNDLSLPPWRYYLGAYLTDTAPPFKVVRVSRRPIVYASEIDDYTVAERAANPFWKTKIVFEGGAVARKDYWLVSVGINDSACLLLKVRPKDLNL